MKPRLRRFGGMWWCGETVADFFTWAACALTPKDAYDLWRRCQS